MSDKMFKPTARTYVALGTGVTLGIAYSVHQKKTFGDGFKSTLLFTVGTMVWTFISMSIEKQIERSSARQNQNKLPVVAPPAVPPTETTK